MLAVSLSRRHNLEAREPPGVRIFLLISGIWPALPRGTATSHTVSLMTIAAGDGVKF